MWNGRFLPRFHAAFANTFEQRQLVARSRAKQRREQQQLQARSLSAELGPEVDLTSDSAGDSASSAESSEEDLGVLWAETGVEYAGMAYWTWCSEFKQT